MSIIVDLAEAVKEKISTLSLSSSHSTNRVYFLDLDLESIVGNMVHVLPSPPEIAPYTRANSLWDIGINVAFTTRQSPPTVASIDQLMSDVQVIMDAFKRASFVAGHESFTVSGITQAVIYDDTMLKDDMVFQSVFTIGFKAIR